MRLPVLLAVLATISAPATALAASVAAVSGDNAIMSDLGQPYIHSRHTGIMPYWGPCYRCTNQIVSEPACTAGSPAVVLASWTSAGNSSCGGYESDTFTAETTCANGEVQLDLINSSYNPADTTGKINYGANIPIPIPNGGNYGTSVSMNSIFGGGNGCSQNFDWYPTYGITGEDVNGTFNGTITFGNYLSPSQYQQSPSFPVTFMNYKLVSQRVCQHYAPTESVCMTKPKQSQLSMPAYSWACNTLEGGWNSGVCSNAAINTSGAEWIFGASDAASGTAQSGYSVMQTQFDNPTSTSIPATLTFAADNYGWVWINSIQVAFWSSFTTLDTVNISIPPGNNNITFMVMNDPNSPVSNPNEFDNPAAGILAITDSSGQTLVSTNDSNWGMIDNPPSTPNPSPQTLLSGTGYQPQNCVAGSC